VDPKEVGWGGEGESFNSGKGPVAGPAEQAAINLQTPQKVG
jgi:hypothetical protein